MAYHFSLVWSYFTDKYNMWSVVKVVDCQTTGIWFNPDGWNEVILKKSPMNLQPYEDQKYQKAKEVIN